MHSQLHGFALGPAQLAFGLLVLAGLATAQVETAKLTRSEGAAMDLYSGPLAVADGLILVGFTRFNSEAGAVFEYRQSPAGWLSGTEAATLVASDSQPGAKFGSSLAFDGQTLFVGSAGATIGVNADQGAIYVFQRDGLAWIEVAKLTASDGIAGDRLGLTVAADGDTVVAGAHQAAGAPGAAYVFEQRPGGWVDAVENAKLTARNGTAQDMFATALAIDGDTIVVGAPTFNQFGSLPGKAYVFVEPITGWASATETTTLRASGPASFDAFGSSVAIEGDTIVCGAPWAEHGATFNDGAAYVFTKLSPIPILYTQTATLVASNGQRDDRMGTDVDLQGDTVIAGALDADIGIATDRGAVYMWKKPATGWPPPVTPKAEDARLVASDGLAFDRFGLSPVLHGDTLVVGAPFDNVMGQPDRGSVYVFEIPNVIEGSACGGDTLVVTGSSRLGKSLDLAASEPGTIVYAVGVSTVSPPGRRSLPGCGTQPRCRVGCAPALWVPGPIGTLGIENDPSLVGTSLCIQGIRATMDSCVELTEAVRVRISN